MEYLCFFGCSDAKLHLNTQNCREKLNNLVVQTHLALRSPLFGEQKKKKCVFFNGIDDFDGGFMCFVD